MRQHIEQSDAADGRVPLYTSALMWTRPLDQALQEARWRSLLSQIKYRPTKPALSSADRQGVYRLISALRPTGRLPVRSGDGRWLQANPVWDPVLSSGDTVRIPLRPDSVTVIREDGSLCVVPYHADAEASYYLKACSLKGSTDFAWVAQPDGTVHKFGIGVWNSAKQTPVAPGAWIWAPRRRSGWPEQLSGRIGEFLATQPPSGFEIKGLTIAASDPATPALAASDASGASDAADASAANSADASNRASSANPVTSIPMAPNVSDAALNAAAPLASQRARDLEVTANDWGTEGLLQMPSARMAPAGEASFTISNVNPYTRMTVMLHPLDWFEFGFRYTDISNHLYGSTALSGTQSYKDKSIDLKIRLLQESAYVPQVAVGMVDVGGTGLFSGEYLVASKRTAGLDWSLGLGWGYIGSGGSISNPLGLLSSKFKTRPASDSSGGVNTSFFRGPMALFGGVQYQLPNAPFVLKVEYDGNDYKSEPFGFDANAKSRINVGVVYRLNKNVDLSAGFERGNRAMLGLTLHGDLSHLGTQKVNDSPPLPLLVPRPPPEAPAPDWSKTSADLFQQTHWKVLDIARHGRMLTVSFDSPQAFYRQDLLDRVATVLHRDAPADIDAFRIVTVVHGQTIRAYTIRRTAWVASKTQAVPVTDQQPTVIAGSPPSNEQLALEPKLYDQPYQRFYYSLGPGYAQTLGGPNGFILYSVSASLTAAFRLRRDTWVAGALNYRLFDNYDKFTYDAPSNLPRVRTYMREYMTTSRFTIPYLQATHVGKIGNNVFYSAYGGLLEPMFAGVGGEVLYRPANSPLALGVDLNEVQQRGFREDFAMRDYRTFTGHMTAYWDTGWHDVMVRLSVGQYLAKDKGATLDISRRFQNGVAVGAYATKTNISAATYGEGSFDKGIYVQIPFDAIMGRTMGGVANLDWEPLTRDGGAKLNRQFTLYDLTDERSPKSLWYQPGVDANKQ